jgi:hypothetical protein
MSYFECDRCHRGFSGKAFAAEVRGVKLCIFCINSGAAAEADKPEKRLLTRIINGLEK